MPKLPVQEDGMGFRPRRGLVFVVLAWLTVVWLSADSSAWAGTRRHDRDDALYLALANEAEYDCAGRVLTATSIGSGTLIAPDWVLTAKHMIVGSPTFLVGGVTIAADTSSYVLHPTEDVGLFRLTQPVYDVVPAELYLPEFGDELGRVATIVGYGRTGTGLTGEIYPAGTRRAGQNMIDWDGATAHLGLSSNCLLLDFDSPSGDAVWMGSNTPLDMEYGPAHGDSGGGLFVDVDGRPRLAGVQSGMLYRDGTANADYEDASYSVRVSALIDWIQSVTLASDPVLGDANLDGRVDDLDATLLAQHWHQSNMGWADGDFNADGRVDDRDASLLAAHWQEGVTAPSGSVPEPTTLVLLASLAASCWLGRRFF
jgi:hypothetical protein